MDTLRIDHDTDYMGHLWEFLCLDGKVEFGAAISRKWDAITPTQTRYYMADGGTVEITNHDGYDMVTVL